MENRKSVTEKRANELIRLVSLFRTSKWRMRHCIGVELVSLNFGKGIFCVNMRLTNHFPPNKSRNSRENVVYAGVCISMVGHWNACDSRTQALTQLRKHHDKEASTSVNKLINLAIKVYASVYEPHATELGMNGVSDARWRQYGRFVVRAVDH